MPSLKDIAKEYADYYLSHPNSQTAYEIARKIKSLTYTQTGKPLSESDIDELIKDIDKNIPKIKSFSESKEAAYGSDDSSDFINILKRETK
jgi:hypothetical protein